LKNLNYYIGRNNNAFKVKSYIDEECEVIGYNKDSALTSKGNLRFPVFLRARK